MIPQQEYGAIGAVVREKVNVYPVKREITVAALNQEQTGLFAAQTVKWVSLKTNAQPVKERAPSLVLATESKHVHAMNQQEHGVRGEHVKEDKTLPIRLPQQQNARLIKLSDTLMVICTVAVQG